MASAQPGLTETQRRAFAALCDGFVPRLGASDTSAIVAKDQAFCKRQYRLVAQDGSSPHAITSLPEAEYLHERARQVTAWCQQSASDFHVAAALEHYFFKFAPDAQKREIATVMSVMSNPVGMFALSAGKFRKPIFDLTDKEREEFLLSLSNSWIWPKRKLFCTFKSLTLIKCMQFIRPGEVRNPHSNMLGYNYPPEKVEIERMRAELDRRFGGNQTGNSTSNANSNTIEKKLEVQYEMIKLQQASSSDTGDSSTRSSPPEFDVIIVGSGCGGSMMACELSEAGYKVLVVEKGKYVPKEQLNFSESQAFDELYERGALLVTEDSNIPVLAGSTFGGGSVVNWACSLRTPPYVREEWHRVFGLKRFGVNSPYFSKALDYVCETMGVKDGNVENNQDHRINQNESNKTPIFSHNTNNELFLNGCKACGFTPRWCGQNVVSTETTSSANSSQIPTHTNAFFGMGDPFATKISSPQSLLQRAAKSGNCVFTDGCHVERVLYEKERSSASGPSPGLRAYGILASYADNEKFECKNWYRNKDERENKLFEIRAKRCVIVSGGAINSPALLLRSKLPNRNGMIGRNLRLHPAVGMFATMPTPVRVWLATKGPWRKLDRILLEFHWNFSGWGLGFQKGFMHF